MSERTRIEWTGATWNPVTGCTKVSEGCAHCYAERMARRLQAMGKPKYKNGFKVTLHPEALLEEPTRWRKPRMVFVCSMGDLFHDEVPDSFILSVFGIMRKCRRHTFQVLTKRAERMAALERRLEVPELGWPENVWAGVSVENCGHLDRIEDLKHVGAPVRFVSFEPLIGPVSRLCFGLSDQQIDWVIVGGETGPGARPMRSVWATELLEHCQAASVPFFFKGWGDHYGKPTDRRLNGREWNEMPRERCR